MFIIIICTSQYIRKKNNKFKALEKKKREIIVWVGVGGVWGYVYVYVYVRVCLCILLYNVVMWDRKNNVDQ